MASEFVGPAGMIATLCEANEKRIQEVDARSTDVGALLAAANSCAASVRRHRRAVRAALCVDNVVFRPALIVAARKLQRAQAAALEAYPLDAELNAQRVRHRLCLNLRACRFQDGSSPRAASPDHAA